MEMPALTLLRLHELSADAGGADRRALAGRWPGGWADGRCLIISAVAAVVSARSIGCSCAQSWWACLINLAAATATNHIAGGALWAAAASCVGYHHVCRALEAAGFVAVEVRALLGGQIASIN